MLCGHCEAEGCRSQRAATQCPECESTELFWTLDTQVTATGVADGRLRSSEVRPVLVQGCDECSETIEILTDEDMARVRVF